MVRDASAPGGGEPELRLLKVEEDLAERLALARVEEEVLRAPLSSRCPGRAAAAQRT
jgi:hypothetical protein